MNVMHLIIILGEAVVMLFQLRSLMQSSSATITIPPCSSWQSSPIRW